MMCFVEGRDTSRDEGEDTNAELPPFSASSWQKRRKVRSRFLDRYEKRRTERRAGKHHPLKRPLRITVGVALILIGAAIGWLPGPGFIIFAFPGALLVASEWRRAALTMDRVEHETVPWIRRARAKLRGGPMPEWVAEDPAAWGGFEDKNARQHKDTSESPRATNDNSEGSEYG